MSSWTPLLVTGSAENLPLGIENSKVVLRMASATQRRFPGNQCWLFLQTTQEYDLGFWVCL